MNLQLKDHRAAVEDLGNIVEFPAEWDATWLRVRNAAMNRLASIDQEVYLEVGNARGFT